ncbi:hypothetical protein RQP53_14890 [Paucibacter sp. APW11]|uniref:Uncharacterized protein n=1 Tax=Roseateles aquae TaxID=3077235 RepID=A0ABU3PDF3_9BURK|nr:hypothetical protein [Paucibacter sp. APW11]MDT9000558.1 hypothetical protein [Paucibacter sp. APW11]
MKQILATVILASLATASLAASQPQNSEEQALRAECAAHYTAKLDAKPSEENEYQFVYSKGKLKGEYVAGQNLDCTKAQYTAFLKSADPERVMSAYPTAAGRTKAKAKEASK